MTDSNKISKAGVLDDDVVALISEAAAAVDLPASRMQPLRAKILADVGKESDDARQYTTIRANEGEWVEVDTLLGKKILSVDENGIESYLLRIYPGAKPGRHQHESDEFCIVLEGDVSFDDVHLQVGDCHIARKGSWHGAASTVNGALIFLQAAVAPVPASA